MYHRLRLAGAAFCALLPAAQTLAGGFTAPVTEAPVLAPAAAPAAADWTGPYLGLALVNVFGADDRLGLSSPAGRQIGAPGQLDIAGPGGAVQLGYRWQSRLLGREVVIGPEISYEDSSADADLSWAGGRGASNLDQLWSLRVKAGMLNARRNTLVYGSLGAARGKFGYTVQGDGMAFDGSFRNTAWTAGLGVEHKLSQRVSVFGEWEFRQFGKAVLRDDAGMATKATPEHHALKLGVNMSF